jgi:hypothetical protein
MALASIPAAYAQFDASAAWYSNTATAQLRLEAVEYLIAHRPEKSDSQGSGYSLESLQAMRKDLTTFIGIAPRAQGRSRRIGVSMAPSGVQ